MKARCGTREASKCWENEVTDTLIKEGCKAVVVAPMMFVSENHGYVTVCHGDDFVSCGSAAALHEIDRVLTTHFDTKILPRIGPTAYGGEVSERRHLGRTIRWSPQGFEWESHNKHVEDMVELCGLKLDSKGAPMPITKARGKGRRDIDDALEPMHRLSDKLQARGVHHYSCNVRGDEWNERAESGSPVAAGASGTVCSATSGRGLAMQLPSRPDDTVCVYGHGLGSG